MKQYKDRYGYIHTIRPKIDYMKELDRLYKKAFPSDKDKELKPKPINEVRALHELIFDKNE